jgi:hypothetical protein
MKIDRFEIDSWGTVKLKAYDNGRGIEHQYDCVPKTIILKLLSAKSTPEMSDFDGWMREYRNKRKDNKAVLASSDWWNKKEDD